MEETSQKTRSVVWKYDLQHNEPIMIPAGGKVLSVVLEGLIPRLYALVDPEVPKVARLVQLLPTGGELTGEGWEYAGSITEQSPKYVCHVFLQVV